jgi:pimeloyl-ACP methyl ester carboxylesterase
VLPLLDGHEVLMPTLAGLGERADGLHPEVGLRQHVDDVVHAIEANGHGHLILVGHSYGGLVVREAANRAPERVRHVVLIDAWAGAHGASLFGLAPEWLVDGFTRSANDNGEGWFLPAPPPAALGVTDPQDAAWLEGQMSPQPLKTFTDATELTGAVEAIPGTAIICRPGMGLPFDEFGAQLGYEIVELESGHDAMVTNPRQLAQILARTAASDRPSP